MKEPALLVTVQKRVRGVQVQHDPRRRREEHLPELADVLHGLGDLVDGRWFTIGQDPTGQMFSILQAQETGYDASQVRDTQANRQDYKLEGIGIYGQMITLFTDCILQDRQPPTSLANGRHSVKVVDAIYRAVRERRVVEVGA